MGILQVILDTFYTCVGLSDLGLGEHELAHVLPISAGELQVSTLTGSRTFINRELGFPAAIPGRVYLSGNATKPTRFRSILPHFATTQYSCLQGLAFRGHEIA